MILGFIYFLGFLVASKLIPGCKIGDAGFNMWMLIPAVGVIVGLIDGLISFIRLRSFSALIAGPLIHTVIMTVSWYAAKMIPWTRGTDGYPTENGLMLTAIVLGVAVVTSVNSK